MPVQWVCRPNQDFRGFAGPVLSGRVAVGDEVVVAASGRDEPRDARFSSAPPKRRERRRRPVGHADARRRDRHQPRRRALARRRPPAALRPVRRRHRVARPRAPAAGPAVSAEVDDAHRACAGDRAQIPLRRGFARAQRREGSGAERDRHGQSLDRRADRLRCLRGEPRLRRLHPDRPLHQPDRRRRA